MDRCPRYRLVELADKWSPCAMDNGPELLAWGLRDWCRLSQTRTSSIEPGAPWENPYVESFNGRVRDKLLNLEEFTSLTVAQVVVEAWRIEYNTYRPHPALGGLTPPSTRLPGPAPPTPNSHSEWTTNRGPVTRGKHDDRHHGAPHAATEPTACGRRISARTRNRPPSTTQGSLFSGRGGVRIMDY
jgi:Integrase core domain